MAIVVLSLHSIVFYSGDSVFFLTHDFWPSANFYSLLLAMPLRRLASGHRRNTALSDVVLLAVAEEFRRMAPPSKAATSLAASQPPPPAPVTAAGLSSADLLAAAQEAFCFAAVSISPPSMLPVRMSFFILMSRRKTDKITMLDR